MKLRLLITYLSSLIFLWYLFFLLLISNLSFILNIAISGWLIPGSVACAGIVIGLLFWRLKKGLRWSLLAIIPLGLLVISFAYGVIVNRTLYDISFDGQSYHSEAVATILEGWNPIQKNQSLGSNEYIKQTSSNVWLDAYPKLPWYNGAAMYQITGEWRDIKFFNLAMIVGAFLITIVALSQIEFSNNRNINQLMTAVFAILVVSNPISILQSTTFSMDGILYYGLVYLFGLLLLIYKSYRNRGELLNLHLMHLALTLVIIINIKTAGLVYGILFVGAFLLYTLLSKKQYFTRLAMTIGVALYLGVGVLGYNPYVTNIVNYGNILYPQFGNKAFNFEENTPSNYRGRDTLQILADSVFFKSSDVYNDGYEGEPAELKLPLLIDQEELESLKNPQLKKGGLGPLFGAILIPAIIGFILGLYGLYRTVLKHNPYMDSKQSSDQVKQVLTGLLATLVIFASCLLTRTSSTLRYIPQIWIILIIFYIVAWISKDFWARLISLISVGLTLLNIGIVSSVYFPNQIANSQSIDAKLNQLYLSGDAFQAYFGYSTATRIVLRNNGLIFTPYFDNTKVCDNAARGYEFMQFNQTQLCYR